MAIGKDGEGTITVLYWNEWGKSREISMRIEGASARTETVYLSEYKLGTLPLRQPALWNDLILLQDSVPRI
jgi:hypothetical protein